MRSMLHPSQGISNGSPHAFLKGDLSKILQEEAEPLAPRKVWGDVPFKPRVLPLEVTASAMEGIQFDCSGWTICNDEYQQELLMCTALMRSHACCTEPVLALQMRLSKQRTGSLDGVTRIVYRECVARNVFNIIFVVAGVHSITCGPAALKLKEDVTNRLSYFKLLRHPIIML